MSQIHYTTPFGFLSSQREHIFRSAINSANSRHKSSLETAAHIYPHMSNRGKAFDTREWGIAHIMEAFVNHDGAKRREIMGINGVEFDRTHFVHFKSITDPYQPCREPRTIVKARNLPQDQMLPGLIIAGEEEHDIPLSELCIVLAGYIKKNGLITSFYFIDQDGETVYDVQELEITSSTMTDNVQVQEPLKTHFTPKASALKREES